MLYCTCFNFFEIIKMVFNNLHFLVIIFLLKFLHILVIQISNDIKIICERNSNHRYNKMLNDILTPGFWNRCIITKFLNNIRALCLKNRLKVIQVLYIILTSVCRKIWRGFKMIYYHLTSFCQNFVTKYKLIDVILIYFFKKSN